MIKTRPRMPAALIVAMVLAILALLRPADHSNSRLFNDSASVPLGFWHRVPQPVEAGAIVGFHPPAAAMAYVEAHMPEYTHRKLILKYVVATSGDRICRAGASFSVNGKLYGQAAPTDGLGAALPQWQGCRTLAVGEVAVFSNRIPNSFDSRYYGTVPAANIIGVYRPLWTW
jgi:conjugative transfer signal peptidase TraF